MLYFPAISLMKCPRCLALSSCPPNSLVRFLRGIDVGAGAPDISSPALCRNPPFRDSYAYTGISQYSTVALILAQIKLICYNQLHNYFKPVRVTKYGYNMTPSRLDFPHCLHAHNPAQVDLGGLAA